MDRRGLQFRIYWSSCFSPLAQSCCVRDDGSDGARMDSGTSHDKIGIRSTTLTALGAAVLFRMLVRDLGSDNSVFLLYPSASREIYSRSYRAKRLSSRRDYHERFR